MAIIAILLTTLVNKDKLDKYAPVAQLDRALGYELRGREFESLQAHHLTNH